MLKFLTNIARQVGECLKKLSREVEADGLLNLGIQQYRTSQFLPAFQSWLQAITIYREIGNRQGEATSLNNLGIAYRALGQFQKAIEFHQQSLTIYREIGDRDGVAASLNNLGNAYHSLGQFQKTIEFYQQSLTIKKKIGDKQGEATSLGNLGKAYHSLEQYQKAIKYHQQSLTIEREIGDKQGEANSLVNLGRAYNSLGQYQKAIKFHQQHLTIASEIGYRQGEATSLAGLGNAYISLGQYQKAIKYLQQSLTIIMEIGDKQGEANCLGSLGSVYILLGQYQEAIAYLQQYYTIALEIGDREGEADSLAGLGSAYISLGQIQKAIFFHQQSLTIRLTIQREIGDKQGEANSLDNLGIVYISLGQIQKAIEYHQQSLAIRRKIGDRQGEANSLTGLGSAYDSLGQYQKAIEYYQQSLVITKEIGDRKGEVSSLNGCGHAYRALGQVQKTIAFHQQSLTIAKEIEDRHGKAASLGSLGLAYRALGQVQKAIKYLQQYYTIAKEIGDRHGEAKSLVSLGIAYASLGQFQKAIKYFQQNLTIIMEIGDRQSEANLLGNLGIAYRALGQYQKAITYLQQYYTIASEIGDRQGEAKSLGNLGNAYASLVQFQKAIEFHQQSLTIAREIGDKQSEANCLGNLGSTYRELQQIPSAIQNYQNCLKIANPTTMPRECIFAGRNLGDIEFTAGNWKLAIEGYTTAIEAVEQSYNWAITDERRQEIIKESIGIYENTVQCYVNLFQYDKALEYTDRSRSKRLLDLMASNNLYSSGEIPPELEQLSREYDELQQRINDIRFRPQFEENKPLVAAGTTRINPTKNWEADTQEIEQLEAQKQEKWQQMRKLDPVLAGQKQVDPLNCKQMQALINNPTTAILSFYTTRNDTQLFILRQNQTPQLYTCKGQGLEALQNWILRNWLIPYVSEYATWRNNMEKILQEICQRLQLKDLIAKHLTDIKELIIVPHLALHQIPFAALPLTDSSPSPPTNSLPINPEGDKLFDFTRALGGGSRRQKPSPTHNFPTPETPEYLGKRFRLRILPSLQILNYCHQRPSIQQQLMGIVEDATSDLYFTPYECEIIAQLHRVEKEHRLKGNQATTSNYKKLVKAKKINQLHSSHHAKFNFKNPLESTLSLADGSFTLGQLIAPGWRMPNLVDVFLSCCETSLTIAKITDNILTIATGFLCAGARSTVSTLWKVDDLATALFSIFYYQERQQSTSRSLALQKSQERLCTLTGEELTTKYKSQIEETLQQRLNQATTDEEKEKIFAAMSRLKFQCQQDLPFVHPVYWAGFISQGLD
ncbi:MAG: tetratricopeptide repeat protein [Xenococcaceae cyanobacterium]